jgi:hypothetical protein
MSSNVPPASPHRRGYGDLGLRRARPFTRRQKGLLISLQHQLGLDVGWMRAAPPDGATASRLINELQAQLAARRRSP